MLHCAAEGNKTWHKQEQGSLLSVFGLPCLSRNPCLEVTLLFCVLMSAVFGMGYGVFLRGFNLEPS